VVWTLAFAPLIGYALEMWTAGLSGMEFEEAYAAVSEGQYWFITLILNIALGYLDERRLRRLWLAGLAGSILSVASGKSPWSETSLLLGLAGHADTGTADRLMVLRREEAEHQIV
jgi:hypothetical protein